MSQASQDRQTGTPPKATVGNTGFASPDGLRNAFQRVFAQEPDATDALDCVRLRWIDTPLGPMVAGANDAGLCLLSFVTDEGIDDELQSLRGALGCAVVPGHSQHLDLLDHELTAYFAGRLQDFTVPLHQPGTAFQQSVWAALRRIPFASTCSYRDVATAVGRPGATRAVGTTNGRNRISIVVPCHRVINAGGGLGGYSSGIERKRWLLRHEIDNATRAATAPTPSTAAAAP